MALPSARAWLAAVVLVAGGFPVGCSSDNGGDSSDTGDTGVTDTGTADADDTSDGSGEDTSDDGSPDVGPVDHSKLCVACEADAECGIGAVCLGTAAGAWCATPCFEGSPCPDGFACRTFEGEAGRAELCVPETGFCEDCPDIDDDGYAVGPDCGEVDCSPADPTAHPGAEETCNGRDDDCDGVADEGFDLSTDESNCGACGRSCDPANGVGECVRGTCRLLECDEAHVDCNGDYSDGCEGPIERQNSCGGCALLVAEPGDPCGACGSGEWTCAGRDRVLCAGDRGDAAVNACGGCTNLGIRVGGACGHCRRGIVVCDGTEDTECVVPGDASAWTECGSICCSPDEVCVDGACGLDADCRSDDDCDGDRRCDESTGACLSWGAGDSDEECLREVSVAQFSPEIQCVWDRAPAGDRFPAWIHVLSTPMVADFDFEGDPEVVRPSIVIVTDDGDNGTPDGGSELPTGLVRVLDGRTCGLQYTLSTTMVSHSSAPAVGDLDGDGRPEIVAFGPTGGLVAFRYDASARRWDTFWTSHRADGSPHLPLGGGWGGPGLHDLNNDGVPEVLRGATVYTNAGVLVDDTLGNLAIGASPANMSFAADLDGDGKVEIAGGDRVWEWNTTTNRWVQESYVIRTNLRGYVAVADFGDFGGATPALRAAPQLVVVTAGTVRVQHLDGTIVFGPYEIPLGGTGGPPTIGDFDGDGRPEFAAAGRGSYTVFDLDCTDGGTHECASRRRDGVLWTRTTQDWSSSQTGSSVFDFEGDDRAEAVFADECFVRVYDGETGAVIFSQQRSSCTWNENPIVADVDGDFNSELVVGANLNCDAGDGTGVRCSGLEPGGVDPQFPGLVCDVDDDCVSGVCRSGYCRCLVDDQCCRSGDCRDKGFVCTAPPIGTPGTGSTCRAAHNGPTVGIRVYADALDHWVGSRRVWNQHAYNVTNVEEDGTIPRTADVVANWSSPDLNNFRQNVQGGIEPLATPDLTSSTRETVLYCDPGEGIFTIDVQVCNRGTEPVDTDVPVEFRFGAPDPGARVICRELTETILYPGECETVSCRWPDPPTTAPGADVWIVPDPDTATSECNELNNLSVVRGIYCG